MMHEDQSGVSRRDFIQNAVAGAAVLSLGDFNFAFAAPGDRDKVIGQITAQHDAMLRKLREWIALPSIAAENIGYPAGAEYMAQLARDAGFTRVELVPTKGKPGVFAT